MGTEEEAKWRAWAREFIGEALYDQLEAPVVHECEKVNPRTWNSADEDKQILRMMIPVVVELILTYIIANINQIVLNKFSDTAVAATTPVSMLYP